MNVYLGPQKWMGKGIIRVAEALETHKPDSVRIVWDRDKADLEIVHVVGCGSLPADLGVRPYGIVQYCFATTEQPTADFWVPIWKKARAVWSYYELPGQGFKYLHQPLGVDPAIFHNRHNGHENGHYRNGREYIIATHGYVAETEGVRECHTAAARLDLPAAHLGPNLGQGGDTFNGLSEEDVAALWSRSERVAALRRVEGFELPGLEGLLCGARPVAFDASHYREWYGPHAEYVPECTPEELTRILVDLLSVPPEPVADWEREAVKETFCWPKLTAAFWGAIL